MTPPPMSFDVCVHVRVGETVEVAARRAQPLTIALTRCTVRGFMPVGITPKGEAVLIVHLSNEPHPFAPLEPFTFASSPYGS